jgi:hypothetical protein
MLHNPNPCKLTISMVVETMVDLETKIHYLFLATKLHKGTRRKNSIQTFPMKNFWESGTLFIKRVLAAGGKVAINLGLDISFFSDKIMGMKFDRFWLYLIKLLTGKCFYTTI